MRTYLEEVNLGLLVGRKESCEEKTRTLETRNNNQDLHGYLTSL